MKAREEVRDMPNGKLNGMWKGGRTLASNGYVLIRVGKLHHLSDVRGYAYEHRIVAEGKLGRRLEPGEIVHHIDGIKDNNAPNNLEVVSSNAEHYFRHRKTGNLRKPGEKNQSICCMCGCGNEFPKYDKNGRPRKYKPGHNPNKSPIRDEIIKFMLNKGEVKLRDICNHITNTRSAKDALSAMKRCGIVTNPRYGVWRLS